MGFELTYDYPCEFPAGSVFWARAKTLRPLTEANFSLDEFDPEQGQTDGTLAHAIERMVFMSAELAGYNWQFVSAYPDYRIDEKISSLETLMKALEEARCFLLPSSVRAAFLSKSDPRFPLVQQNPSERSCVS
jgi:hypothetical protein